MPGKAQKEGGCGKEMKGPEGYDKGPQKKEKKNKKHRRAFLDRKQDKKNKTPNKYLPKPQTADEINQAGGKRSCEVKGKEGGKVNPRNEKGNQDQRSDPHKDKGKPEKATKKEHGGYSPQEVGLV